MNLLDKYVAEVGKGLPRKNRVDIETEIRSTLQDMLDERSAHTGKPADDAMLSELLKEYGAPRKVAASYRPAQYLIGPRIFPIFELVTRIVFSVLLVLALIGFGISFANHSSGPDFINALGKFALQLFGGLISAFGNLVLVFAILERVLPASEFGADDEKEWDPAELEKEPDPAEVKPAEPIFTIIFTLIGLLILNLYPDLIGLGFVTDGRWTFVPVLSDAFFRYLPWINLLGILEIGLNAILLREGHWRTFSRIAELTLKISGIILAAFMLAGPSLVNISAEKLANTPLASASRTLAPLLSLVPIIVLTIILITSTIEVATTIYRMFNRPATLFPGK